MTCRSFDLIACLLICLVFSTGCHSPQAVSIKEKQDHLTMKQDNRVIKIDNGYFRLTFLNPDHLDQDPEYGCRFIRAGWIRELCLEGDTTSIFRPHTVFPNHPTFGYTHEIYPALNLKTYDDAIHAQRLNIGVGIIKQNIKNRFKLTPVKLFPWETHIKQEQGKITLVSEQVSGHYDGYAYRLTIKTTIKDHSPTILFEQILENTGTREISASAYVHPFFNAMNGLKDCWYILPQLQKSPGTNTLQANLKQSSVSATPGMITLHQKDIPPGENWVAAGNFFGKERNIRISSNQALEKTIFWRTKTDCFAVEPFVKIHLFPGEKKSWQWTLAVERK